MRKKTKENFFWKIISNFRLDFLFDYVTNLCIYLYHYKYRLIDQLINTCSSWHCVFFFFLFFILFITYVYDMQIRKINVVSFFFFLVQMKIIFSSCSLLNICIVNTDRIDTLKVIVIRLIIIDRSIDRLDRAETNVQWMIIIIIG